MRPEYLEAVDAARWGWTLWLILALPAATIWWAAFTKKIPGCAAFAIACAIFCLLVVVHASLIQGAKESHATTDAEMTDFTSDTWFLFAPMAAVPYAMTYCTLNWLVAAATRESLRYVVSKFKP